MVAIKEPIVIETVHGVKQAFPSEVLRRRSSIVEPADQPLRTVLLVDDSAANRRLFSLLLQREGYDCVIACNGREAVEHFEQQPFAFVMMDIHMPVMDGLEATRRIRRAEQGSGRRTQIIAATAGMDEASCLEAGVDMFLEKPIRLQVLRELLRQLPTSDGSSPQRSVVSMRSAV